MKARGIYETATGYRVIACIGRGKGRRQERRFPAGTAVRTMTRWQADARTALREAAAVVTPASILDDLETAYLPAIASMPTKAIRERHLRMWADALGTRRPRSAVTSADVRAVLERWQLAGWAKGTCNRARTALMHFYSVLGGKAGANPVRDVPKYREPRRPPKRIDYATFERILDAMPDIGWVPKGETRDAYAFSRSKVRLRVIAYTGLPHAQVMHLKPEHVLWTERLIYIEGRHKGAGTVDRWLPVSQAGMAALRAFAAAKAWGRFSTSTVRRGFRKGAAAIGRPDLTPYDLRHLFGTTLLACSKNRAATRDLMLHTSDTTTARYVAAAMPIEWRAALDAFDDVVGGGCGTTNEGADDSAVTPRTA